MRTLLQYIKPYRLRMASGLAIKTVGTIMDLFLPWILAHMIDEIVPKKSVSLLLLWGCLMLVCAVVALLGNVIANRMASKVARDTTEKLRYDLFSKSISLSARQTDAFTIPSLISRLSTDTYNVHQMIGMIQRLGVRAPILLFGGIAITFAVEPVLALVLLAVVPFLAVIVYVVSTRGTKLYTNLQRAVDGMVRSVRDNYTGIRIIKALSKTEYEKERFRKVNDTVVENETKAGVTMAVTNPTMNFFLNLGMTAVILVGAFRVNAGRTHPGQIIAFMTYFTIILNAVISVSRIFVMWSKGSASARRIQSVLDAPQDLLDTPMADSTAHQTEQDVPDIPHIEFDHVTFSFDGVPVIHDISLSLKRGQTLGVIGETGCGKSTLIQLLLRFYDPDSGAVRIGGQDIREMDAQTLRSKFGVVFQNDFLIADTIFENIDFGRGHSIEEVKAAAQYAQAQDFIEALDDGYEHALTARGANFSGGQKQRLLIARALCARPEILILDDSSSALDYQTDAKLRRTILEHFRGTTTILVAQRISSIRFADSILVLDEGKIAGYGSDEQLMEQCALYRQIYDSQVREETNAV